PPLLSRPQPLLPLRPCRSFRCGFSRPYVAAPPPSRTPQWQPSRGAAKPLSFSRAAQLLPSRPAAAEPPSGPEPPSSSRAAQQQPSRPAAAEPPSSSRAAQEPPSCPATTELPNRHCPVSIVLLSLRAHPLLPALLRCC
ncbi:unnamed protein product, partial [Closterium sp. NIES-54]